MERPECESSSLRKIQEKMVWVEVEREEWAERMKSIWIADGEKIERKKYVKVGERREKKKQNNNKWETKEE